MGKIRHLLEILRLFFGGTYTRVHLMALGISGSGKRPSRKVVKQERDLIAGAIEAGLDHFEREYLGKAGERLNEGILAYLEEEFVPFVVDEQVLPPPALGALPARYGRRVIFFSIIELMRRLGADEQQLRKIVRSNAEKCDDSRRG